MNFQCVRDEQTVSKYLNNKNPFEQDIDKLTELPIENFRKYEETDFVLLDKGRKRKCTVEMIEENDEKNVIVGKTGNNIHLCESNQN